MRERRAGLGLALFVGALVTLAAGPSARHARAVGILSELATRPSTSAPRAPRIAERDLMIAAHDGPIRARLYFREDDPRAPGVVVAHGVHRQGIDERRLVPFARALARSGHTVLTPELTDLADYRISASSVDVIRNAVTYARSRHDVVEPERIGLIGFSFAGGLALVAAADPDVGRHLAFVTSVGGHHDLGRVLRFLVRNRMETPAGFGVRRAHEYGLVVLLYGHLERFVPARDLGAMRGAVKAWLEEDRPRARRLAAERTTAESERLWKLLEAGRVQALAPELDAVLAGKDDELRALSPSGRLRSLGIPVYLLHGAHDSVIPPSEVEWAAAELRFRHYEALVTPLLDHVSVAERTGWDEHLALVRFVAQLML